MIAGLPEDALLARPEGQDRVWTTTHELLASVVEVVSVPAADRRLKKPIEVPRPAVRRIQAAPGRPERAVSIADAMPGFAAAGRVRHAPAHAAG